MTGNDEALVTYCGLCCLDCHGYQQRIPDRARDLRKALREAKYDKFAAALSETGFGKAFQGYDTCYDVLGAMVKCGATRAAVLQDQGVLHEKGDRGMLAMRGFRGVRETGVPAAGPRRFPYQEPEESEEERDCSIRCRKTALVTGTRTSGTGIRPAGNLRAISAGTARRSQTGRRLPPDAVKPAFCCQTSQNGTARHSDPGIGPLPVHRRYGQTEFSLLRTQQSAGFFLVTQY